MAIDNYQWRLMQNEAQLAAEQIAHGVTLLGKANHAQKGYYAQAFFALSIGLERMGKIIYLAEYVITTGGRLPSNQELRKIGHDIQPLLRECETIGESITGEREFKERPSLAVHTGIEEVLSLFATSLRYYNLNTLAGATQGLGEPIKLWWEKVAARILEKHYTQEQQQKDQEKADSMDRGIDDWLIVRKTTETGEIILDYASLFIHDKKTKYVQRYSQLYTLQIVRWLSSIIYHLSYQGAYIMRIDFLLGLHEPFAIFLNEDKFLRSRTTWTIYI